MGIYASPRQVVFGTKNLWYPKYIYGIYFRPFSRLDLSGVFSSVSCQYHELQSVWVVSKPTEKSGVPAYAFTFGEAAARATSSVCSRTSFEGNTSFKMKNPPSGISRISFDQESLSQVRSPVRRQVTCEMHVLCFEVCGVISLLIQDIPLPGESSMVKHGAPASVLNHWSGKFIPSLQGVEWVRGLTPT